MKIQNAFRFGLFGGLGVLLALAIGSAVGTLATILTYIGAAIFLALGLDPAVSWLERHRFPRWAAILTVVIGVLGVFTGLMFAVVPVIVEQMTNLITNLTPLIATLTSPGGLDWIADLQSRLPDYVNLQEVLATALDWVKNNVTQIGGGVLQVGLGIASGLFGGFIVLILTLYFVASLNSVKRGMYQLVPASRRARFADISEQITGSVGRYVIAQVTVALCNGVISFIWLTVIQAKYPALFAFIAFLFALVPLVGTITGSTLITLACLLFNGVPTAIAAGIFYLVYMQIEAYVIGPNIMRHSVKVPGLVVVIAALIGGTLLGILGALIAIPVAASVLIIINQVMIPRQNEL